VGLDIVKWGKILDSCLRRNDDQWGRCVKGEETPNIFLPLTSAFFDNKMKSLFEEGRQNEHDQNHAMS
jgi:hypothetical protein